MNRRYIAGFVAIKAKLTGLLQVKTSPGKPSLLPPDVLEGLRQRKSGTASTVTVRFMHWLAIEYNVQAAYQTVHGIVRYKLQSKLKLPRPVSTEANPDVQATFKKLPDLIEVMSTTSVMNCPFAISEDESRLGLKTVCGRVITLIGLSHRSRAMVARQLLALWCS